VVLTKTVLSFVSPVVSPGGVKMGRFLITCDDRNNYSTHLDTAICAQLMTSANSHKNGVFTLRSFFRSLQNCNKNGDEFVTFIRSAPVSLSAARAALLCMSLIPLSIPHSSFLLQSVSSSEFLILPSSL
jgi:hypothetical protein